MFPQNFNVLLGTNSWKGQFKSHLGIWYFPLIIFQKLKHPQEEKIYIWESKHTFYLNHKEIYTVTHLKYLGKYITTTGSEKLSIRTNIFHGVQVSNKNRIFQTYQTFSGLEYGKLGNGIIIPLPNFIEEYI